MKIGNKKYKLLFIFGLSLSISTILCNLEYGIIEELSNNISQSVIDRDNKIFTNITESHKNCFINNKNPLRSEQPQLYLPNHHLSYARMNFENIRVLNYTKNIETEFSDSIKSSKNGSIYVYQKFSVKMSQYVNNVTILIQDVNNETYFSDENSWEVAIVNCLQDDLGTPNPNASLAIVQKPHPIKIYPEWVTFDFKNSPSGPVYLNISETKHTNESGIDKYWFAFRIKIPPEDTNNGGGPKFLYFNLDEGGVNDIGEGDIFAKSPDFIFDNYTLNEVSQINVGNGNLIYGNETSLDYFKDQNELLVSDDSNEIKIDTNFNVKDLRNYPYSYKILYDNASLWWLAAIGWPLEINWLYDHYKYIFKMKISLALNISNPENVLNASLYGYNIYANFGFGKWEKISQPINLTNQNSKLINYEIREPLEKLKFLSFINSTDNNSMQLRFEYIANGSVNVSIDKFTFEMGEIDSLPEIQKYDPLIEDLEYPSNITIENDTLDGEGNYELNKIINNDNDNLNIQADSDNLTINFHFNILNDFNEYFQDVNFYDWMVKYPYPYIPKMDVRISSNVSINNKSDLTHAILEIYKGEMDTGPFEGAFDLLFPNKTWIPISDNKTYAIKNEKTIITELDPGLTWIFLQLLNESNNNLFKMRLRYIGNKSQNFEGFNVSIDEVGFKIYLQNLISSDITSKIGFGVDGYDVTPEYIGMLNNGNPVQNNGIQKGIWDSEIYDGIIDGGNYKFNITSIWPFIQFDVNGTYEIYKIKPNLELITSFKSEYMTGNQLFSVNVTGDNGTAISNLKIYFQLMDSNNKMVDQFQAITDENGIASVNLDLQEVGTGYSIRVQCAEEDFYTVSETYSNKFRVINGLTIFLDILLLLSPVFIAVIVAIVIFLVLRHKKIDRLRKEWEKDAQILEDLLKLSYIMIIHKEIGVAVYSQQISSEKLDPDLISGFLHAISSFKTEFKRKNISHENRGFEMDYYDFHINLTDGKYVRIALISEAKPSQYIKKQQVEFTNEFEQRYEKIIQSFNGDTSVFDGADKLTEKYFNISLIYPLQINQNKEFKDLDRLEKHLLELAAEIQKEKDYFFFSDLLSFGLVGHDEPRNKVISSIIGLKDANYLRSFQI